VYALAIPEVYNTWEWTQEYPGSQELQRYFQHVDNILDISKDTIYNTRVSRATWDDSGHKWNITCDNGTKISARFMHCCLGFAAKRHFPDWPGFENYKGYMCHSSFWPVEGVDMKGKKMAVVGNGATGIQIAQTAARDVAELGVFVRTPNTCIPMNQKPIDPVKAKQDLDNMAETLGKNRYDNHGGFLFSGADQKRYTGEHKKVFDDTEERRNEVLDTAMDLGGFRILFTYDDILLDEKANRYVYDRLIARTRARMTNKKKMDILAPLEPPHPFAGKRPSLEQGMLLYRSVGSAID
jgi:cation diffusion facilitator CzcD-associated flavoprotein CzcO